MRLEVVGDYDALSAEAARFIADELRRLPAPVLLAATGSTPTGAYELLAARYRSGALDTSCLTVVQLDEYAEIGTDDRRSLHAWTRRALIEPLGIPPAHVIAFEQSATDA